MYKNVGILTTHDVYNYGSSLQAYALQTYIRRNYVCSVKIIDYAPDYLYRLIDFMEVDSVKWQKNIITRTIYRVYLIPFRLSLIKKYLNYKNFNKTYLNLTQKKYRTYSDLKKIDEFDFFVCGSDQIWNSEKYKCGEDPSFYLEFTEKDKISYAASFGTSNASNLGKELIKKNLKNFKGVSVREKSGQLILSNLKIESKFVLDPVFLVSKEEWEKLSKDKLKNKKYIFVYGYDNSSEFNELIKLVSERKNIEVIDLKNSEYIKNAGPREFLDLISNAEMVLTTSFHAVAFSIIFNTPFVACSTHNKALYERIDNLLTISGLQSRKYDTNMCIDELFKKIDFEAVNNKIQKEIENSKKFLADVLG